MSDGHDRYVPTRGRGVVVWVNEMARCDGLLDVPATLVRGRLYCRYWGGIPGRSPIRRPRFDGIRGRTTNGRWHCRAVRHRYASRRPCLNPTASGLMTGPERYPSPRAAALVIRVRFLPSQSRALRALDGTMSRGPPCRVHEPWRDALRSTRRLVWPATVNHAPRRGPPGGAPSAAGGRCSRGTPAPCARRGRR